jgi:DNA-binding transcriptional LysR family regulator
MQEFNWNDLRYVLAIVRTGRLAEAARRSKVNETTIARRIARMEEALGSQLFRRNAGFLIPTESGHRVVAYAERVETEIGQLKGAVMGADERPSGSVRITSTPWLINRILIPGFGGLHASHPQIMVELISDRKNLDVTKREADIAVRLARPQRDHRALARRIATLGFAVYGPMGKSATSVPWIGFEEDMAILPQSVWISNEMRREEQDQPALRANDSDVILHAIVAGLGKSLLPCVIGDSTPGLVRLSGHIPILNREVWLIVHPELRRLSRVRVVKEWIETTISSYAAAASREGAPARTSEPDRIGFVL